MANLAGLMSLVSDLRVERTNLATQLRNLDEALAVLDRLNGQSPGRGRTLSAAARKKISLAQKARWAKRTSNRSATVHPKQCRQPPEEESRRRSEHGGPRFGETRRRYSIQSYVVVVFAFCRLYFASNIKANQRADDPSTKMTNGSELKGCSRLDYAPFSTRIVNSPHNSMDLSMMFSLVPAPPQPIPVSGHRPTSGRLSCAKHY
jgi:hypothetical protein